MKYRVDTESGACHEVDTDTLTYRRLQLPVDPSDGSQYADLRRDGEWLSLLEEPPEPLVVRPWMFVLVPLNPRAEFTVRVTTPVVRVEHLN